MKILIITAAWSGGGAEAIARESYDYFRSEGHDVYFANSRGDVPDDVNAIQIGNKADTYMHALYARIFDGNGFGSVKATKDFIKKIEILNPDIIQIHNPVCYVLNIPILFSYLKKSKIKTIWTLHDCWAFTGHCAFFDDVNCNKYLTGCGECPGKKEYPKSILLDRSRKNFIKKRKAIGLAEDMTIVTPSEWLGKIAKTTFLNKYDIKVINNGLDVDKFAPVSSDLRKKYSIKSEYVLLGVANKWTLRKGLQYFIDLAKIINNQRYKIVLIGAMNTKQKQAMPDNILTIDRTDSFEVLVEWYSIADVYVNTTIADNFPTVNLEALACGTPVVTFDTGGSWESVGDLCGEKVIEKSGEALLKSIEKCITRNITTECCISRAKEFDKKDRYAEYLKLYQELLEG